MTAPKPHANCNVCGLKDCIFVPSQLPKKIDSSKKILWIVGEAPGETEAERGVPFVGKSGRLLREVLDYYRFYDHFNVVITNACLCRPPNNRTPKVEEIRACEWHLKKLYEVLKPDFIIACGRSAAIALGLSKISVTKDRGKVFETPYGPTLVTFHPSAILRKGSGVATVSIFKKDFLKALKYATGQEFYVGEFQIVIPKTTKEILELFRKMEDLAINQKKFVAFDVETLPIPWDDPLVQKTLGNLGLDPYNPYSGIQTIAFAVSNLAFAFPVDLKKKLEFLIEDQTKKYQEIFGTILPDDAFQRLLSLKNKLEDYDEEELPNLRHYKSLAVYVPALRDYLARPGEETFKKLLRWIESVSREVLFPPEVLRRARQMLENYDFDVDEKVVKQKLKEFATNEKILKVAHNAKFEFKFFLHELGVEIKGLTIDTMLLAYLLDESMKGYYNLSSLVSMYLPQYEGYKEKHLKEDLLTYNAMDAALTLQLARAIVNELQSKANPIERANVPKALEFLVKEATPFLAKVELNGFYLDFDKVLEFKKRVENLRQELLNKIEQICGTKEITKKSFKVLFYNLYEHEPIRTEKGELSLNSEAIRTVYATTQNENLKRLCAYLITVNKLNKLDSAYFDNYVKLVNRWSGRIHPNFNLTGTETGRLSSSNPNFQQIPRDSIKICPSCKVMPLSPDDVKCPICGSMEFEEFLNVKEVVAAPPGRMIIAADYSQMEVRVLAEFSKDPSLMKALKENLDMHSYSASKIFGIPYEEIVAKKDTDERIATLRQQAKAVTFGLIYGQTAQGLAERFGISVEEAEKIIQAFYAEFQGVEAWIRSVHNFVKTYHVYYTPIGRVRRFHVLDAAAFREAQNFPIQSFASDVTLVAAIEIQKRLEPLGGFVIGLVHDSIEAEVPEDKVVEAAKIFKEVMEDYVVKRFNLQVPIVAEIEVGKNWGETESLEEILVE